ncbi:LOW QUALITY PROTEIN: hypothetical protein PanWU01x14_060050, partial [Parasponia andersonii]
WVLSQGFQIGDRDSDFVEGHEETGTNENNKDINGIEIAANELTESRIPEIFDLKLTLKTHFNLGI